MTCFWTLAKIHVNMNTLATSLYHTTFKCIPRHNKLVVKCLSSQAAVDKNVSFRKRKPISKAMRAYIDRVKEFEANFAKESAEYVSGKRFLANVMCEDPNNFTDEDVKKSLEYLLPSGLYQLSTRPTMEPPKELVETSKFDVHGRPYHYLFYTAAPKMYELQHEAVVRLNKADKLLEEAHRKGHVPENEDMLDTLGSEWVNNNELSNIINENVRERHFESVMDVLKRLCDHPMSAHFEDFIMTYRKNTSVMLSERKFPEVMQKEDGGLYVQTKETRKTSTATVTIHSPGTGKICINKSHDLLYFPDFQSRNQIIHPLQMAGLTNKVDVYAEVFGGGYSGQAGAIRYGVTVCVAALSNEEIRTKLHIAGLLTRDRRVKERKKTGKKGARRSYTWLKR